MVIYSAEDGLEHVPELDYALGFFYGTNFLGSIKNGMKFYLENNKISRLCRIELQSIVEVTDTIQVTNEKVFQ